MCANFTTVKETLVDKILDQGQRLRNAMVQSILENDPISLDNIIYKNKTHNSPINSSTTSLKPNQDKKLLEAFLNGDYLTKDQEDLALNTIRSMPVSDVCETTQRTLSSKCRCATCTAYSFNNLKCDLRRSPNCSNLVREFSLIRFVDSLKVILQSIHLNEFGVKKVNSNLTSSSLNETYFVEYYIPEVFTRNIKSKSKIDSGLESGHVRICAKRTTNNNVIHIKQTYIHSVCNLYNHNLEDYDITFSIKYKTRGQTKSQLLGISKLNLGVLKHSKNASCGKTLPIQLNEESPISLGTFKVTLQLGAGKLYFGQEFVDAVLSERESEKNSVVSEEKKLTTKIVEDKITEPVKEIKEPVKEPVKEIPLVQKFEGELLFGFLYISEANFLNLTPTSYILCQPFCQNDTSSSRIVFNSSNPLYNFCQTIPLLYEECLLLKLRENFTVIEFWEKQDQSDILFGCTRLPLQQFYLGYRNTVIFTHLKRNKLPIIGTDWWEPIYSIDHNQLIGQVQVLTALGTEEQIRNLEIERGFRNNIVKAKFPIKTSPIKKNIDLKPSSTYFKDKTKINRKPICNKRDIGVQSESMDKQEMNKADNPPDMLASFLKILEQRQKPPCVENSTNTDNEVKTVEPPQLKKTSDLLDSLQNVLTTAPPKKITEKPPHFRAQININSANQLPSRRKIKSKSKRVKNCKQEDNILPSTYVTFETLAGEPLQITSVFPKSTQPQWNFTCQVCLPMELLTNGPKRLIFKVWKKCTNAVLQPNSQTDQVLGFAALDLSVLAVGLPSVQGWFNIIDFSGKCNGQINIHVIPLEKIDKTSCSILNKTEEILPSQMAVNEESNEVLSRALKRKFTELDEITQRLRLRLSEVVSEDSENSNDEITEEFEHDINNLCVEEDFDLINFEDEAKKLNQKLEDKSTSGGTSSVLSVQTDENLLSEFSDKHIIEGKHRIDTLLEKLSLMTAEVNKSFTDRYVSGCSTVSNDIEVVFKNLEQTSRPNITATNNYNPEKFQLSGAGSNDTSFAGSSSRPNPVGQGEDKKV